MTLATEQGFPQHLAAATPLRGWALAACGHGEEGMTQIQQGLAASRATRATRDRPYHLALLAEASAQGGQTTEGLEALAEALSTLAQSGVRWCEAELYRLRGELLLQHARQITADHSIPRCPPLSGAIQPLHSSGTRRLLWGDPSGRCAAHALH
jgi:predicted ATPase